jgi:hypothetical protein
VLIAELWYLADSRKKKKKKGGGSPGRKGSSPLNAAERTHAPTPLRATWSGGSLSFRPSHFVCLLWLEPSASASASASAAAGARRGGGASGAASGGAKPKGSWRLYGDELRRYAMIGKRLRADEVGAGGGGDGARGRFSSTVEHIDARADAEADFAPWIVGLTRQRALLAAGRDAGRR